MRLLTGLIRLTYSKNIMSSIIFYSSSGMSCNIMVEYYGTCSGENLSREHPTEPSALFFSKLNNNQYSLLRECKSSYCFWNQCLSAPLAYLKSWIDLFWSRALLISKRQLAGSSVVAANKDPRRFNLMS